MMQRFADDVARYADRPVAGRPTAARAVRAAVRPRRPPGGRPAGRPRAGPASTSTVRHHPSGHHRLAAHPDVGDQPARGRPHQVLDQHGVVEQRHERRVVEGDRHHVGPGPGGQHPEVGPAEGRRRRPGWPGRAPPRPGRAPASPWPQAGQHGGQPHLLPQVEVVVGGRAVGARARPARPAARRSASGAMPEASLAFDCGQWATATSWAA